MFVSSYNTYVNVNNSQRIEKKDTPQKQGESFAQTLSSKTVPSLSLAPQLPVNYISNYKALSNQQKLQQDTEQHKEKTKFTKINATVSAKEAYTDNSKIFSFLVRPKATLDQTPKIDKKLPQEIKEIKENNLRHTMVNTYLANENYYKITA